MEQPIYGPLRALFPFRMLKDDFSTALQPADHSHYTTSFRPQPAVCKGLAGDRPNPP
jgi:hypothetical protein